MSANRLPGIDGLRAVAALWVVLFHVTSLSHVKFSQAPLLDGFLNSGATGVSLFLVLSGFCLYLPFAGGRTERFRLMTFFKRRFLRLAPAYYVSLVFSLGLVLFGAAAFGQPGLSPTDVAWQLGTHLTFTHSLFPDSFYALNAAYWSLGLEWQLYLGLPLVIIGVRRFGMLKTLCGVFICTAVYRIGLRVAIDHGIVAQGDWLLAEFVLPNQVFGRWAEFGFGILAAELYVSGRLAKLINARSPWLVLSAVLVVPLVLLTSRLELRHVLYGALFFVLLCLVLTSNNPVSRFASWRPLVVIGTMSYSLYLVHQPIIQLATAWFAVYEPWVPAMAVFVVLLVAVVPAILLVAWLMFVAVERRTLKSNRENSAPVVSPSRPRLRFLGLASGERVDQVTS
jgi:peptidoglycan/LPS O-acetylase OafA/YrhL